MSKLRSIFPYVVAAAILLLLWKITALLAGASILPQPERALKAFVLALGHPDFWKHFGASASRAVTAMVLAWCVAFPLGILMGASKRINALLAPMVFLTYPIPKIVLLPIFLLLLGLGNATKVAMIGIILAYQVLVTTRDGVQAINTRYTDSVRSLGATKIQILREVYLPAALPHGFTALRLSTGTAVAVLFFVESFATVDGLGFLIMDAWASFDFERMFSGILGMCMLGVGLFEFVNLLERRACAWSKCR